MAVLCTHPSVWMQFYFKRIYIFSLDGVVHFFSLVYTGSVMCAENVDLSDVLLRVSFPTSVHTGTAVVVQR